HGRPARTRHGPAWIRPAPGGLVVRPRRPWLLAGHAGTGSRRGRPTPWRGRRAPPGGPPAAALPLGPPRPAPAWRLVSDPRQPRSWPPLHLLTGPYTPTA